MEALEAKIIPHLDVSVHESIAVFLDLLDHRLLPVPVRLQPHTNVLQEFIIVTQSKGVAEV